MMDPELIKLAQEHMSKIPPGELLKMQQQLMANPELMQMATESMKNMNASDLKFAAEQMKNVPTEDMAAMGKRIAEATPEELATMKARADLQSTYVIQAAQNLKTKGNQLHAIGKYSEAAEKYSLAKTNVRGISSSEARSLLLACSLNLMSCHLKTGKFEDCIKQGSEVLEYDAMNVKALYRRGQAYRHIGSMELSLADFRKAADISPDDETILQTLREANDEFTEKRSQQSSEGPCITEITEEEAIEFGKENDSKNLLFGSKSIMEMENNGNQTSEVQSHSDSSVSQAINMPNEQVISESLNSLSENPDMIRSMQSMMANISPESIAALSGGKFSPDMVKTVSETFSKMSSEELQNMIKISSSLKGENGYPPFPSEERTNVTARSNTPVSVQSVSREQSITGEASTTLPSMPNLSELPNFPADMQDQMRNQMKDPMMRQMLSTMVKGMTPEMMSSMSEKFGVKLSHEDAVNAHKAISSLSPNDLDRLMNWMDKFQRFVHKAKMFKNWMLGKPGLIFAILMLIFAMILHWLGFIGQ